MFFFFFKRAWYAKKSRHQVLTLAGGGLSFDGVSFPLGISETCSHHFFKSVLKIRVAP